MISVVFAGKLCVVTRPVNKKTVVDVIITAAWIGPFAMRIGQSTRLLADYNMRVHSISGVARIPLCGGFIRPQFILMIT